MTRLSLLGVIVIACASPACKSESDSVRGTGNSQQSGAADESTPAAQRATKALVAMASEALEQLEQLETTADVTCWTSFRQLDWYIAEKTYSEFATVAKVTAIKALVRAMWVKASASSDEISAATVAAVLGALPPIVVAKGKRSELRGFANDIGLRNYTDYQKTAEHWRLVLAVIQDEIYFGSGDDSVSIASGEALVALADGATTLSLHLLKRASALAEKEKSANIEAPHVKSAFRALVTELELASTKRTVTPMTHAEAVTTIAPLTKQLIEGKGKALVSFNRASGDLTKDLNRVSELPLAGKAADVFYAAALSFVHFATSGADTMRADNYLADGSYAGTKIANAPYIDHLGLHNLVEQLFPHRVLANGDVLVRFEPNPGPLTVGKVDLTPFEIRLVDHRMNGVRDSAVHWKALAEVFVRRAYAIDPFAAEYLSEVVSMMITLNIERATRVANKRGASSITAELANEVVGRRAFVQVPIGNDGGPAWTKEWAPARQSALRAAGRSLFVDVTRASGLPTAVVPTKPLEKAAFNLQDLMGAGVAVGDVNGDGFADVYLAGDGLGRLMINRGKSAAGKFADKTSAWKLAPMNNARGALFFDIEGDGDLDLVVVRDRGGSGLFRNDGGSFVEVSKQLGLDTGVGAHAAHVFDYDGDDDLDIYIGYYGAEAAHRAGGKNQPALDGRNGIPNQLWRNDGDNYVEVGKEVGVADVGWTLAVGSFDYERDGDLDLYVANDFGANSVYRNDGRGRFSDVTAQVGGGDRGSGMNVDFSDINGDGFWDVYVTNIDMFSKRIKVVFPRDESTIDIDRELAESFQYLSGNKLYLSTNNNAFVAAEQRLIEPGDRGWGWDALFFDYENDGDDDLYLANGWIDGSYAGNQKNQMFLFNEVFHLAPQTSAEAVKGNTRSVAAADFDRDGDIDLILNQFRGAPIMLRNVQRGSGGWVRLSLRGRGKNPRAIGALVEVSAGSQRVLRQVSAGRGYLSQTETELLIGVGNAKFVDVDVHWPGATVTKHRQLRVGERHELVVQ